MRSRVGTAFFLVASIALTSCASPTDPEDAEPASYIEAPAISAGARKAYGDRARQAYDDIVRFSTSQWIVDDLLDPRTTDQVTVDDLSRGIVDRLTPSTAKVWRSLAAAAVNGDDSSRRQVLVLRIFDVTAPDQSLPEGRSPVEKQTVTDGSVDVGQPAGGITPLTVTFTHSATFTLVRRRAESPVRLEKQVTYTLVPGNVAAAATAASISPSPAARWRISTFDGTVTTYSDADVMIGPTTMPTSAETAATPSVATTAASGSPTAG